MPQQTESNENQHIDPFLQLSETQWRYVTARVENPSFSKKDAAEHIGIKPNTVYGWPDHVEQAVTISQQDIHAAAVAMRKQAVMKAMAVKLALLNSEDELVRSKAATEVIEWELGKATQPTSNQSTSDITVRFAFDDDDATDYA